jgi:hypothetical protein
MRSYVDWSYESAIVADIDSTSLHLIAVSANSSLAPDLTGRPSSSGGSHAMPITPTICSGLNVPGERQPGVSQGHSMIALRNATSGSANRRLRRAATEFRQGRRQTIQMLADCLVDMLVKRHQNDLR